MSSNAFLQAIGRPADVLRELEPFEDIEPGQPGTVSRDYPITLPPDRVDADGTAYVCSTEDCTGTPTSTIGDFRFCDACRADLQLPTCEPYRAGETSVDHGARVLAFILQTSCYATLSDLELERAHHASQYAICARGISVPAADRLSDVRHVIASTLTWRKGQPAEPPAVVEGGQLSGKLGTGGPADREPLQPKPRTEPPAAAAVLPPWQPARDRVQF